jgi:hypothetical protein
LLELGVIGYGYRLESDSHTRVLDNFVWFNYMEVWLKAPIHKYTVGDWVNVFDQNGDFRYCCEIIGETTRTVRTMYRSFGRKTGKGVGISKGWYIIPNYK